MTVKSLHPYLNFNGTAEKAIHLYERALGAKTDALMRLGEMPGGKFPPEAQQRVLHASLNVNGHILMISDTMPDAPTPLQGNTHVLLDFDDVAEMTTRFESLAEGGTVSMPLNDTFWGARFGMLTDAYGVQWMFNCTHQKP